MPNPHYKIEPSPWVQIDAAPRLRARVFLPWMTSALLELEADEWPDIWTYLMQAAAASYE